MDAGLQPSSDGAPTASRSLTTIEWVLVVAEVLLAIGALGGALGLLFGFLDLHEATEDLPLQSPVLGGIALGLLVGLLPLVVSIGTVRHKTWSRVGHVVVGVVLLGWIAVQVAFIGFGWGLQAIYAVYGAVVTVLGLWNIRTSSRTRRPA